MPVADYATYCKMLENAYDNHFAYPAINVTSEITANAALKAFADLKSDGIIQVSTGGGKFASGLAIGDMVLGAISIAEHIHRAAAKLDINVAIHTDHCPPKNVDDFLIPLIEESEKRVAAGELPLYQSHMLDASCIPLEENMALSVPIFERMAKIGQMIEVEAGVVGGEEDGASGSEDTPADKLYTTPEDMVYVYEQMGKVDGKYMFAATFGNVHGAYKPGAVKLRPDILKQGQDAIKAKFGDDAKFWLVFHGGSGSAKSDIHETLDYGVVKMNVDTDCQYAFTRALADHFFANYDSILKIDGEVGNKKFYDPRSYLKKGEEAMANRVKEACEDLRAVGKTLAPVGAGA
ncbi:class II fructose-bisphosphate aldolase [Mucisphaera calidilacus]|uniref:Fructose-bisphosphate aldolase n=1 Tax=Mucisphaera calidilacus TaxID=2527982 RepID=A0A518BY06_9BACT|nr:class II fructose-bisphosphate aldolase [Mucisphaera calidilacus]QDU71869.1 Fructose-bisphosphate aldolase [Mucisphaera calidilacus]